MSSNKRLKMSHSQTNNLTVSYTSSDNENFEISRDIEAPAGDNGSVEGKTRYLHGLRELVGETQGEVNRLLTERMEEDKERVAAKGGKVVDDAKEEENYGEEVVEED